MSGKAYNGEKAAISLTSWKGRIATCGLTIFSLLALCKGFHVVLTLSETEFPKRELELPNDIKVLVGTNQIELLWVKGNPKAFKKVLFAMDKYKTIPVISADDDCIYKFNYASLLYHTWLVHRHHRICFWCKEYNDTGIMTCSGYATLHPPYYYGDALNYLSDEVIQTQEDDIFYAAICLLRNKRGCICLNKRYEDVVFTHDEYEPLHDIYSKSGVQSSDRIGNMIRLITKQIRVKR